MVDVTPEDMFLSISYPDLDFNSSEVFNTSGDVDEWEQLESTENEVRVTLTADVNHQLNMHLMFEWFLHILLLLRATKLSSVISRMVSA